MTPSRLVLPRSMLGLLLFITAGIVVERKPGVRRKMNEDAMRRSEAVYLHKRCFLV